MDAPVEFFWDVGSPYTYLASTMIDDLERSYIVDVRFRPFLLGGVFKATGNEMPARNPAKGKYMFQDLMMCARYLGVPLNPPPVFPANSLLPMRVAVWADREGKGRPYAKAILRSYWVDGKDPGDEQTVRAILSEVGLDADAGIAAAADPAIKEALKEATAEAVERGAFGAPTFFLGDQMFWGHDRLNIVASLLEKR